MTYEKADSLIKASYPPAHYSILRQAFDTVLRDEPVKPKVVKRILPRRWYFCGSCCSFLCKNDGIENVNYCQSCGRKVDWSDIR